MHSKFAIIVILSTFNLFVHSMDNPGSSSGRRRRNLSERFVRRLSINNTENVPWITGDISQDVPSSSRGIRHELPHLVTPELDQKFKRKYGLLLNHSREGILPKEQFDEEMEKAAKKVFDKMIEKQYEVYTHTNVLTDENTYELIPYDERMELLQRRNEKESKRQELIAEYNWLQKEHLNKPNEQIGLDTKIHRVQETGEHYMDIDYINRGPRKYYLESPHRRD